MTSYDPYHLLTGKNHPTDASVLEIAEHGRVGGLSTGEPYKKVGIVDGLPTDAGKSNPSTVLSYNANGDTVKIVQTIGATNYTTNITPQNGDTVIVTTKTISAWT